MISALFVALVILVIAVLGIRVSNRRRRYKVMFGDGGHEDLLRHIRAHANAVEHFPTIALGLILADSLGTARPAIIILGALFFVGRLLHAVGMIGKRARVQFWGSLTTFTLELGVAGLVIVQAIRRF